MYMRSSNHLFACLAVVMVGVLATVASATEPETGLPKPVTLASMMTMQDGDMDNVESDKVNSQSGDLPASVSNPSGILSLATDGPFYFEPLPTRGTCVLRPDVRCIGPDYRGCNSRIYYGTSPCDDDPILTMTPNVCDVKTTHWYTKAWNMVVQKKAITEALKQ